mmetsp:Transcript_5701/g.23524  ORF Transcript_5701/g.23524 Transcript_5701/m.23524 type:complete len:360 (+) Transcript_5701:319-1398(+)
MSMVCAMPSTSALALARSSSRARLLAASASSSARLAASSASAASRAFLSSSSRAACSFAAAAAFSRASSCSRSFSLSVFCCAIVSNSDQSESGMSAAGLAAAAAGAPAAPLSSARFAQPSAFCTLTGFFEAFCFRARSSVTRWVEETSTRVEAPPAAGWGGAAGAAPALGLEPPPSAESSESESESESSIRLGAFSELRLLCLLGRSSRDGSGGVGGSGDSGPSDAECSRNALRLPLPSRVARMRSKAPSWFLSLSIVAPEPRDISSPLPDGGRARYPGKIRRGLRRIQRRELSIHARESSESLPDDARATLDVDKCVAVVGSGERFSLPPEYSQPVSAILWTDKMTREEGATRRDVIW